MASFTGNSIKDVYKDILHTSNSNTGIGSTIKQITCGDGDTTALHLSDRNLKVQPSTDSTTNSVIYDASGNALLTVDSTNDLVKAGIGQHNVNTQYAHFGASYTDAAMTAGKHYAVSYEHNAYEVSLEMGTGTNPNTSLTISNTAHEVLSHYWYIMDNITIDRVVWFSGADAATGDTTRCHLMSYDIDTGNGSTGGDLSNGAVLADGSDVVNAGYEQIYYQQLTIGTADVNAGKVIMFTFRPDSINSDYQVSATIKYHLR